MRSVLLAIVMLGLVGCGAQIEATFEQVATPTPTASTTDPDAAMATACEALPEADRMISRIGEAVGFLAEGGIDAPGWDARAQELTAAADDLGEALEPVPGGGRLGDWKAALLLLGLDAVDLAQSTTGGDALRAAQSAEDHVGPAAGLTDQLAVDC